MWSQQNEGMVLAQVLQPFCADISSFISKFWLCKHQWKEGLGIAHISWAVQVQEVLFLFCLSKHQFWYLLILLVCCCGGISFLCFTCIKCFPLELCGNITSIICHWLIVDQNAMFFVSANPTWTQIPSEPGFRYWSDA